VNPKKLLVPTSLAALAALVLVGAVPARAEDDAARPPPKTEAEQAQERSMRRMEAWMKAMVDFAKDIRLQEADLRKWIELMPSFHKIGEGQKEEEDLFEKCFKDGKFSFDYILKHAAYGKWAREHGVDGTPWLKKHMRITMFVMRKEGLKQVEMAEKQLPQQLKQIDAMKGQLDESMYSQMRKHVESSVAMLKKTKELYLSIPQPGEEEAKLLEKYDAQIRRIMGDDEDDEECEEEEDGEEEDGDHEEDDED
jgi:hypothetical protein